jgi:hypothetical protein
MTNQYVVNNPTVNRIGVIPQLIDPFKMSDGGERGANEYREGVGVKSIIGRHGSSTYFRGTCWNCGHEMICKRLENRTSIHKCPECEETSTMNQGFFNNRDRWPLEEYVPLKKQECIEDIYVVLRSNDDLPGAILHYTTEEEYRSKESDEYWSNELLDVIEVNVING